MCLLPLDIDIINEICDLWEDEHLHYKAVLLLTNHKIYKSNFRHILTQIRQL